jgi:3-deoxy-D-manno-octulosonic-acid transferase
VHPLLRLPYAAAGALARLLVATGVPGDGKLARTLAARRALLDRYRAFARERRDAARPLLWMHAPSVGEGLQAMPVLERVAARRPDVQRAYTHFSPSAERFAARSGADFTAYLPFDRRADVDAALDALRPDALVLAKLDVWPLLVERAQARGTRLGMISATLAASSARQGTLARLLTRDAYAAFDAVGAIDDADAARLVAIGVREAAIRVTGDTRHDQVAARAARAWEVAPWLARFRDAPRTTLVAGSTWPADDAVLLDAWAEVARTRRGALRLVVAPHEPTPSHLEPVERWATRAGLACARLDAPDDAGADVVLVDRVGVLGELYAIADMAYVGGGFHAAGLHSVLEPAAFGAPVAFGPRHHASRDAALLLAAGGAVEWRDARAAAAALARWCDDAAARRTAGAAARATVTAGLGAADRATELVLSLLPSPRARVASR